MGEQGLREPTLAAQALSGSDEPMSLDKSPVHCTGPGVSTRDRPPTPLRTTWDLPCRVGMIHLWAKQWDRISCI